MFLKEANSARHIKLILTSLFRELTDEDKMYENSLYLQKVKKKKSEDRLSPFQDKNSVMCREIFLQDARPA
jgi:hypothetical protein